MTERCWLISSGEKERKRKKEHRYATQSACSRPAKLCFHSDIGTSSAVNYTVIPASPASKRTKTYVSFVNKHSEEALKRRK